MLKQNLALVAGTAAILATSVAVAAVEFDGAPARDQNTTQTRKNGDMIVIYNGGSYRAMSTRRGSMLNRTYVGGGLRGGK